MEIMKLLNALKEAGKSNQSEESNGGGNQAEEFGKKALEMGAKIGLKALTGGIL